jgi:hypothetical protein
MNSARLGKGFENLVDSFFQGFTGFEAWFFRSSDFKRLTRLRVTTDTRWTISNGEGPETNQYNRVASLQSASDGFDYCVQRTASSSFRDISGCGDSINQFRLVNSKSPYISIEYDSKFFGESKNQC